jgi:hypothetical protein
MLMLPFRIIDAVCQFVIWPPSARRLREGRSKLDRSREFQDEIFFLIRERRKMDIAHQREIDELKRRHDRELQSLRQQRDRTRAGK